MAERQLSSGGFAWALRDGENGWSNIAEFAAEDRFDAGIDAISDDGRTAYARDPRGGNFAQLVSIDLVGGQIRTLANAAGRSIVASRSVGGNLPAIAYAIDPARRSWGSSDPALRRSLQDLSSKVEGDLDIIDTSVSGDIWLVAADQDRAGRTYFRYEREAGTVTRLFNDRPHLNAGKLLSLFPITLSARDGVTLPGYFTLPYQVAAGGDAAADQLPPAVVPVPLVVLVHGGPWARDHWGYHPIHQWLGNRGYAVMSINFRGSVGFGRAHHVRGAGEWGQAMQHDLYDAIAWAIERGYVDKDRVAFIGGSYGGYATVQALLDRQSPAACGVAVSAPVDLISLVESVPAWWASARQILNRNVGETSSAAFRETLRARSPLYSKQQIKGPLLMAHGSEDRRAYPSSIDAFARAQSAKT
ncbi:MAG: alpha/beta fold hydrolase, partial [Pseudomonadota bacterium]